MVRWKPFGCLSLQALAPKWRAESLTRIQLARKTSGIWWGEEEGGGAKMAVWELSSQPEQRKKEALRGILFITNAWRLFCMCMSFYFELIHTKLKWHPFLQGSTWKWAVFQQITSDFVESSNTMLTILFMDFSLNNAVYMCRCTQKVGGFFCLTTSTLTHKNIISWFSTNTHTPRLIV